MPFKFKDMKRKTVNVRELLEYANEQLSRTDSSATKEFKIGICAMIRKTLHTSNNYNGFQFIDNENSDVDTLGYYSRIYYKK